MKTLAVCLLLLTTLTVFINALDKEPPVQIWGDVWSVNDHGVVIDAAFTEKPGQLEAWKGFIFLTGHPDQKILAEGDHIKGVLAERIGTFDDNGHKIRAYKYLRAN